MARLVSRVERVVVHREGDDLLGAASWGVGACQTDQIVAQEIVAVGFGRGKVWRTTLLVGHATPHEAHGSQRNFHLLGLPPVDMLEEVAKALRAAGLDVVSAFLGVAHRVSLGLSRAVGLVFD